MFWFKIRHINLCYAICLVIFLFFFGGGSVFLFCSFVCHVCLFVVILGFCFLFVIIFLDIQMFAARTLKNKIHTVHMLTKYLLRSEKVYISVSVSVH